ncbi:MAG: radical SAM protein [Verrucomicrobia bacterium]|nr:radical SAM protein [Verrucomicrobiota bacterium]
MSSQHVFINEVYLSVQGESTWAGLPCVFVRFTACNLRCSYCDTAYAFSAGRRWNLGELLAEVRRLAAPYADAASATPAGWPLVELTGGEPLLQPGAGTLMTALCNAGFTVLLETSGALDIAPVDPRVHRIMDLKCPSSGEVDRNRWANLGHLRATDQVKFVIGTVEDYTWAKAVLAEHRLASVCPVLFSWATPLEGRQPDPTLKPIPAGQTPLTRRELVERILADHLPVRFQLQMHKFIWPPDARGV